MSKGDWAETIINDKNEICLNMSDEEISNWSKNKFRKIVKESIMKKAFEYLNCKKESHSKMKNINYDNLKMQTYLKSDNTLSNDKKFLLFKLRTRMTKLKMNFKNMYVDQICPLCWLHEDSQSHIMEC